MKFKLIILILAVVFSRFANALYKDTNNVKVKLISVWTSSGDILVQTEPRANIEGLTCTKDYWLILEKNTEGFESTLSMLLTAQTSKQSILISAIDNADNDYCKIRRVITLGSE